MTGPTAPGMWAVHVGIARVLGLLDDEPGHDAMSVSFDRVAAWAEQYPGWINTTLIPDYRERVAPSAVNAGGHPFRRRHPAEVPSVEARSAARPWTEPVVSGTSKRITVKRACNGCGSLLGDVVAERDFPPTPEHRCAYKAGRSRCRVCDSLPVFADVRAECPVCTPQPGKALALPTTPGRNPL